MKKQFSRVRGHESWRANLVSAGDQEDEVLIYVCPPSTQDDLRQFIPLTNKELLFVSLPSPIF